MAYLRTGVLRRRRPSTTRVLRGTAAQAETIASTRRRQPEPMLTGDRVAAKRDRAPARFRASCGRPTALGRNGQGAHRCRQAPAAGRHGRRASRAAVLRRRPAPLPRPVSGARQLLPSAAGLRWPSPTRAPKDEAAGRSAAHDPAGADAEIAGGTSLADIVPGTSSPHAGKEQGLTYNTTYLGYKAR